jgi:uncharacterized protein YdbL (DUF1318 family)
MLRFAPLKLVALCLMLSACVTINVYFPAAAAEKAADRIIEDVWGSDGGKSQAPKRDDQTSWAIAPTAERVLFAAVGSVLNVIVSPAHAQADLNVSTPAIRQLTQSMEARHAQLKPFYDSGAVGFTRDGLIEVRDQNLIALPDRNRVRKLVSEENADRTNLYREIATGNNHPEWEADIRATFAERWISKAAAGWYYQDKSGAWQKK